MKAQRELDKRPSIKLPSSSDAAGDLGRYYVERPVAVVGMRRVNDEESE